MLANNLKHNYRNLCSSKFAPSITEQNVSHPTLLSKTISTSLLYNRICLHSHTGSFWITHYATYGNININSHQYCNCRSQWPRALRRRSTVARLLRSWVRIPSGAWMSVCCECCVLSGRGLCDELITRPEESYRLWCVVCDLKKTNLVNGEVKTH